MNNKLFYTKPASNWDEALPIGNGRLAGMIFGGIEDELIQLNEDSIWSGNFRERENSLSFENLPKIRKLIAEEKLTEAEKLCEEAFYGTNDQQRHYQPLGDFHLRQNIAGDIENYKRTLDIAKAISTVTFTSNGVEYTRKMFASNPDEAIVIMMTAKKDGVLSNSISFVVNIDGRDDYFDKNEAYDDSTLLFTVSDGTKYACAISSQACGGVCKTSANRIVCENASSVILTISAQTAWRTGDYINKAIRESKAAIRRGDSLEKRHVDDYTALYNRCAIKLNDNSEGGCELPTDERLARFKEGKEDNGLIELYFNFSRYLIISASRQGTLPTNLQGIWNKDMWPAWGCKFTININTEMNYWGVEQQNLSECHTPLFDHIERMREHGRVTARKMYGCKGVVCHHNTDIWGDTAPQDRWMPATLWPMGYAWLCTHIWEHYLYTQDKDFLAEKYDAMKEGAEFFVEYLIDNGKGQLVVSPSVSPENTYITKSGTQGSICQGASMDSQILRTLFGGIISASKILGVDEDFASVIEGIMEKLPCAQIGKYGQIMEWAEDYDEAEPGHRHISQLFALYPSDLISTTKTPELANAARATIERRLSHGGGHTGWSRAWIINMWARLCDGERVGENLRALLSWSTSINMFDMHPPFQIDGNYGGGAGIGEALMQSHSGEIALLPAIPSAWQSGSVNGMIARGAWEVSFEWDDAKVIKAEFVSRGIHEKLSLRQNKACENITAVMIVNSDGSTKETNICYNDGLAEIPVSSNTFKVVVKF